MSSSVEAILDVIAGTWQLVNWQRYRDGAAVDWPFGEDATGQIMYDRSGAAGGHMSGFLARADWPGRKPQTTRDYAEGFFSYGGPWALRDVDGQPTMFHTVEFASFPRWIGGVQVRQATLDGDLLRLEMRDEKSAYPTRNFDRLTWKKRAG